MSDSCPDDLRRWGPSAMSYLAIGLVKPFLGTSIAASVACGYPDYSCKQGCDGKISAVSSSFQVSQLILLVTSQRLRIGTSSNQGCCNRVVHGPGRGNRPAARVGWICQFRAGLFDGN
jgi:hypothetical protein